MNSDSPVVMFYPYVNERARELVDETLRSRWIGEGPRVVEFEAALRERFGFEHAVSVASGTGALHLALAMIGVGPGDEVITPAYTCTATNMPILMQFAHPVFADVQYHTGNINPRDIEHRITENTRAIMCVHWAGYPCDIEEIHAIAARHNLPVVEDAAHALGASYHSIPVGNISDYTCFSFQAIKQLTTGDGGLLTVRSEQAAEDARERRWFAINRDKREQRVDGYSWWDQCKVGYKYQLNDIAASIGLGNMEDWVLIAATRQRQADAYREAFEGVPGVTLFERKDDRTSGNWLFTMHVEHRDAFSRMMRRRGIEVSVVHVRNDDHSVFGPQRWDLPQTNRYSATNVSLPIGMHVRDGDLVRVMDAVRGGW